MYDNSHYKSYTSNTSNLLGFGQKARVDEINLANNSSSDRIWRKLYQPEKTKPDPDDGSRLKYYHYNWDDVQKQQMARRMDRKVIKLEAAYGSERQFIIVKRTSDLIVRDVMEEVNRVFKIPMDEQVVFHKGTNLCDYLNETLENLGVENNHQIRVCRDEELRNRSPRSKQAYMYGHLSQQQQQQQQQPSQSQYQQQPQQSMMNQPPNTNRPLSPVSYLKEISPQRVPDPTPHKVQLYNQAMSQQQQQVKPSDFPRDVLKLYVTYGSDREYMLVHGRKPLMIYDLKLELNRLFKIPMDKQCIVFKGYYLHEYLDDAPLEAFGLENNSPITVWYKGENDGTKQDIRLPRPASPNSTQQPMYSPRDIQNLSSRWVSNEKSTEVLKIEVQHGSDRHPVILKGQDRFITVQDLQNEIERITAVPIKDQRLFFRSQELHLTPSKTLKECEIENNCSIKCVGEPSKVRYSNYFGRLQAPTN